MFKFLGHYDEHTIRCYPKALFALGYKRNKIMSKLILIVDDALTVRNLAKYALTKENFKVIEAEDGLKGLEALKNNTVDLIITDFNMPHMNGLEMAQAIKKIPELKHIPIFMLTTEATPESVREGRTIGVTGWILKPFVPDKLIEAVKKVFRE